MFGDIPRFKCVSMYIKQELELNGKQGLFLFSFLHLHFASPPELLSLPHLPKGLSYLELYLQWPNPEHDKQVQED